MGIACRHCGSPARNNPCWHSIKTPGYRPGGGDPPCFFDIYDEEQAALRRKDDLLTGSVVWGIVFLVGLLIWAIARANA